MELTLTVQKAPHGAEHMLGKSFRFWASGCRFGRGASNDIVLVDPQRYVSSNHAVITYENGQFTVIDQSANGLFIDGSPTSLGVGRRHVINNGEMLGAGEYLLKVSLSAQPSSSQAQSNVVSIANEGISVPAIPGVAAQTPNHPPQVRDCNSSEDPVQLALQLGLEGMSDEQLNGISDEICDVVKRCVEGVMVILANRRNMKSQLHMEMTQIQPANNNALKFSVSADEALETMFAKSGEGYMAPANSIKEAFQDIADHQVAMMAAMMQASQQMMMRFHPDQLESEFAQMGSSKGLFSGKQKPWDLYKEYYKQMVGAQRSSVNDQFIEDFAAAYEQQLQLINMDRKQGNTVN
ncbi:type VI secretion system-associated FHA domain protein TagH [Pseudoteredinibacter isoporae]|uniref:Putative component of type VI protein secretion system n=1 Tax=Pseudoteredinibacter isoporae TaxID=570281 RepID=A0A7X0JU87_9GAMM|nr:type VI secretion system-associated FHA domain protein TagH [Pseudoteredinibacter isoporae]MBB6521545.1 putative component of type VI protein secretion system [Pseudoteredinibacter isoporae]NHO87099.1 type VI secretion system-associated FHA domain protein TagH [Pseudoteredinibacter isoporae]NIB22923.1 type VI secretion system-associated FHA domain protein TagH [Pseudoteredinibacter isoporae]